MTRMFQYYGPLDIACAFSSKRDLGSFLEYSIVQLNDHVIQNKSKDFIPPVVYSGKGRVFNFDLNFVINCLDDYHDNVGIKEDFYLTKSPSPTVMKNAYFLVTNIFDEYYDVVRIKQRKFDPKKIRSNHPIEIKNNFYNPLIMKNGDNVKRFSAVPFSATEVKKIVSDSAYNLLESITNKECIEQVAFGVKECMEFVRNQGFEPEFITE